MENITIRKKMRKSLSQTNVSSYCTINDEGGLNSSLLDITTCSLSSLTQRDDSSFLEELNNLRTKLLIADKEIDELNYENQTLKNDIEVYKKQIEMLKKLTSSTQVHNKILTTPLRRRTLNTSFLNTSNKKIISFPLDLTQECNVDLPQHSEKKSENQVKPYQLDINLKQNKNSNEEEQYNIKKNTIKNICIIADEQGKGLRKILQRLVGPEYLVKCFWKENANFENVLKSIKDEIKTLNDNDIVIILGGIHDKNPFSIKSVISQWLKNLNKINILISEIPRNKILNKNILNKTIMNICHEYKNVDYVDMNYDKLYIPNNWKFTSNLSKSLLREILRIDYKNKMNTYLNQNLHCKSSHKIIMKDKCTQTSFNNLDDINLSNNINNVNNSIGMEDSNVYANQNLFRM